jgi:hypothetical protein
MRTGIETKHTSLDGQQFSDQHRDALINLAKKARISLPSDLSDTDNLKMLLVRETSLKLNTIYRQKGNISAFAANRMTNNSFSNIYFYIEALSDKIVEHLLVKGFDEKKSFERNIEAILLKVANKHFKTDPESRSAQKISVMSTPMGSN